MNTRLSLACAAGIALIGPVHAHAGTAPQAVFQAYVQAVNAGSLDHVRALLSPDVARPPFSRCPPSLGNYDCTVQYLDETAIKRHSTITVNAVQVQGDTVLGTLELRNDATRAAGIDRLAGTDRLRVRDGRIIEFAFLRNEHDPQTMKFFDFMRAHAPAQPHDGPPPPH